MGELIATASRELADLIVRAVKFDSLDDTISAIIKAYEIGVKSGLEMANREIKKQVAEILAKRP